MGFRHKCSVFLCPTRPVRMDAGRGPIAFRRNRGVRRRVTAPPYRVPSPTAPAEITLAPDATKIARTPIRFMPVRGHVWAQAMVI